jgi:hypothetical protein
MTDDRFDFQLQMERPDATRLQLAAELRSKRDGQRLPDAKGDGSVRFGSYLILTFTDLMPAPYALVIAQLEHPQGTAVLSELCVDLQAPIQLTFADQGDLLVLPPNTISAYGPADLKHRTATFGMLTGLTSTEFGRLLTDSDAAPKEDDQTTLQNPTYVVGADMTRLVTPVTGEPRLARYEYILMSENLSVEDVFFGLFGLRDFQLGADRVSAYAIDEARELRIYGFLMDYEEGRFWTLTVTAPDLGPIRECAFTWALAERALALNRNIRLFGILAADDLQEALTTQEFRAFAGGVDIGGMLIFNALD